MNPDAIINARLRDRKGLHTIRLEQGRISGVELQDGGGVRQGSTSAHVLDAAGGFVTPSLVDAHVHLDLAYSCGLVPANESGTLFEAIASWSEAKREISAEDTRKRAERAIRAEVGYGTGFLRSHVDVSSAAEMRLCEGVLAACEATRDICKVQLVAFPQDGLIRDPKAEEMMRAALRAGIDIVGGIPHVERTREDGLRHLGLVFDLAAEFNAPIDIHIDETDDPESMYTEHLAALALERGWAGRVTASHVCALSSYTDVHAARAMDLLAEAQINVVTNPGVNLFLQGRFDNYPKRRGLTRVRELLDRGIKCAAGQDCINDPFYPLGKGQLLEQVFLLVHAEHMSTPARFRQACEMVCCQAGEVIGLGCHRVTEQAPGNLLVHAHENMRENVRLRTEPRAVLHGGRLVAGTVCENS